MRTVLCSQVQGEEVRHNMHGMRDQEYHPLGLQALRLVGRQEGKAQGDQALVL